MLSFILGGREVLIKNHLDGQYRVKAKKAYNHLRPLMRQILEMRMYDNIEMNQNMALEPDDPRRISRNSTAIPPPHTQQLALQQRSMLSKADPDKTIDYVFTE